MDRTVLRGLSFLCLAFLLSACTGGLQGHPPSEKTVGSAGTSLGPEGSALQDYAEALAREYGFSGAVLVARGDRLLLSSGYGFASDALRVRVSEETRFPLASVTKPLTATAVMILVDQGRLSLGEPICAYLQDCPGAWKDISVRQLLNQTAGLPELDPASVEGQHLDEVVRALRRRDLLFPPGTDYTYSNSNYYVAGALIEEVSETPWDRYLDQVIFDSIGMTRTISDSSVDPADPVVGYSTSLSPTGERIPITRRTSLRLGHGTPDPDPAGGLLSTLSDLHGFARALDNGDLLTPASMEAMWRPLGPARFAHYGLGWERFRQNGTYVVQHGGAMPGFSSCLSLYPREHLYVAVLSNVVESVACEYIGRDLGAIVLGRPYRTPKAPPRDEFPVSTLDALAGVYQAPNDVGDERVEVQVRNNRVVLSGLLSSAYELNDETVLRPWSPTAFFNPHDPYVRITFDRDSNGQAAAMVFHRPAYKRLPPTQERWLLRNPR